MAYYSTFIFRLPNCPEIKLSTRYDVIQDFDQLRAPGGGVIPMKRYYKPRRKMGGVVLTKSQRRKVHTFLNVIYRHGIHKIPRKYRRFVLNSGVFPEDSLQVLILDGA